MNGSDVGYGPQVGISPQGFPVYLYTDPNSKLRTYIVVLPDGRAFYSNSAGKIVDTPVESDRPTAFALLGGLLGFAFGGPGGAIFGSVVGAIVGNGAAKKRGG
jgi:hypothetical protein